MPTLVDVVTRHCAVDLNHLSITDLQTQAHQLRTCAGRLPGRLDQALSELNQRAGGQVRENPDSHPPRCS